MQADSLKPGTRVLVIDDLLATGGSMSAACQLLNNGRLEISQCLCIIELRDLNGRNKISAPVHTFLQY